MSSRKSAIARKLKTGAELTAQQPELHGITCTSCYFSKSVSYWAMGRSILSLYNILLLQVIEEETGLQDSLISSCD